MHVVAITRLASSLDDEARALAADLGSLPYDQRLRLKIGLPAIILSTSDAGRAAEVTDRIAARGHGVVRVHSTEVWPTAAMPAPRRIHFDDDALFASKDFEARIRWHDIVGVVRAVPRTRVEQREEVAVKSFGAGPRMFNSPFGARLTRTKVTTSHQDESIAYLFLANGATPWVLRERTLSFDLLGDAMLPSMGANFDLVISRVVAGAHQATFDDALVGRRTTPVETELLAYIVARSWEHAPYR